MCGRRLEGECSLIILGRCLCCDCASALFKVERQVMGEALRALCGGSISLCEFTSLLRDIEKRWEKRRRSLSAVPDEGELARLLGVSEEFLTWLLSNFTNRRVIAWKLWQASRAGVQTSLGGRLLITYCPLCKDFVDGSVYLLTEAFPDDYYAYWIANLVKHYRHEHIRYYDLTLSNPRYARKNMEWRRLGESYEEFKKIVNNRAKRQIMRGVYRDENLTRDAKVRLIRAVFKLQHNDEKTEDLAKRLLRKLLS